MIELRFHEELYDGFAVDEAAKAFAELATLDLVREQQGYVVRVTAREGAIAEGLDEATIAAELDNYALGKTIERTRAPKEATP